MTSVPDIIRSPKGKGKEFDGAHSTPTKNGLADTRDADPETLPWLYETALITAGNTSVSPFRSRERV